MLAFLCEYSLLKQIIFKYKVWCLKAVYANYTSESNHTFRFIQHCTHQHYIPICVSVLDCRCASMFVLLLFSNRLSANDNLNDLRLEWPHMSVSYSLISSCVIEALCNWRSEGLHLVYVSLVWLKSTHIHICHYCSYYIVRKYE